MQSKRGVSLPVMAPIRFPGLALEERPAATTWQPHLPQPLGRQRAESQYEPLAMSACAGLAAAPAGIVTLDENALPDLVAAVRQIRTE
jgi:hypothetical protein